MDLQTLQAKALAAREFTHTLGVIDYRLRTPTRHDVLLAAQRAGALQANGDRAAMLVLQRAVLEAAIVGWQGVRVLHVLVDGDGDGAKGAELASPADTTPLGWEPGAVPLLLDARPDDAIALADALNARITTRAQAAEADAKN
jgi:hypothetical protein